eukprot:5275456-Prymnesium_polylepis.1
MRTAPRGRRLAGDAGSRRDVARARSSGSSQRVRGDADSSFPVSTLPPGYSGSRSSGKRSLSKTKPEASTMRWWWVSTWHGSFPFWCLVFTPPGPVPTRLLASTVSCPACIHLHTLAPHFLKHVLSATEVCTHACGAPGMMSSVNSVGG